MLPVCSTNPRHSQVAMHGGGGGGVGLFRKDLESRFLVDDRPVSRFSFSDAPHLPRFSYIHRPRSLSLAPPNVGTHSSPAEAPLYLDTDSVRSVADTDARVLVSPVKPPGNPLPSEVLPDDPSSLVLNANPLSSLTTKIDDLSAGVNASFSASFDSISSSLTSFTQAARDGLDNAVSKLFSAVDQSEQLAGNTLTSFTSELKGATVKATAASVDVLRSTIVAAEDSASKGISFVVYSYASAKQLLPPEIRDALDLSEEKAAVILRPVGAAFQQGNAVVEGLERSLGLNPNDPVVSFFLLLGTSATLWVFYWVWAYGGYSGDLSPESTMELLAGKQSAALIDVRPEIMRERDGIPDLRRTARFRYASVTLPEVDGSMKKLLKGGVELDDALIAVVVRNLKIVQDRSKVIVMDADGSRSKGVARSLRKLGVKQPYLIQGGFQSWRKQGLRVKELKPETALTILNEEAEAILEDISPTPVQILGYSAGLVAALYALSEWEKTLQLIGIFGLGLTIYWRVASYENAEDFRQDVRLLLAPVRLGAQAFSWAAGKLENNRVGLPTSPSSSDVQNRVLKAAAKLESQPSDTEGTPNQSLESVTSINENVDLSEA